MRTAARTGGVVNVASRPLHLLSLCSGVGMHDLGLGAVFHARTVCYVEREAYAASQLVALMEAGCLDAAPVWSDLVTFDARPWRGLVDGIVAGLPCQPYSPAGKQQGNKDKRAFGEEGDGPIVHFLRIVDECRPAVVFLENVSAWVTGGWFRSVGEELCRLGYEIEDPLFLGADDVGASHQRERVWILAYLPGRGQRVLRESWRGVGRAEQGDGVVVNADEFHGEHQFEEASGCDRASGSSDEPSRKVEDAARAVQRGGRRRRIPEGGGEVGDSAVVGHARRAGGGWEAECRAKYGSEQLGYPESSRSQGGGYSHDEEGREVSPRPTGLPGGSLFAPGPSDSRWADIVVRWPFLAPAILAGSVRVWWDDAAGFVLESETESGVRGVADGTLLVVDESRRHQLRAIGNGGVPECSSVAFGLLARRVLERGG